MKITRTATKLGVLLVLAASMTLTGCTDISDEPPTDDDATTDSPYSGHNAPNGMRDFSYTTEDGTTVQCVSSYDAKGLSCDWEGAERPGAENPGGETSEKVGEN